MKTDGGGYIPTLDGWRSVAIALVALSHCGLGHIVPGGLGVTIFFFLSGYLITTLIFREVEREGAFSVRKFYIRRAVRLYPPLLVLLAFSYALVYFDLLEGQLSARSVICQLTYVSNYCVNYWGGKGFPEGTGILWSLAIEEHFYVALPVLYLLSGAGARKRNLVLTLLALCVATLVWRIYLVDGGAGSDRIYYLTDTRFDAIAYGCLFSLLFNPLDKGKFDSILNFNRCRLLAVVGLFAILASLVIRDPFFRDTWRYSIQSWSLMPIFYYAIKYKDDYLGRLLGGRIFVRVGQVSYAIYLFHAVLIAVGVSYFGATPVVYFMAMVFAIAIAFLVEAYVERPAKSLRAILGA